MTDCCTIGVILDNSFGRFYWVIPKVTSLTENVGDFYWSPEIRHLDNIWKLCMYPQGTHSIPGYIMLQVWRKNVRPVKAVRFSFDIYKNDFEEEEIVHSQRFDSDDCFSSGLLRFMRRSILLRKWSKLAFMDNLNVVFTIWIDEPISREGKELVSVDSQTEEMPEIAIIDEREQPDLRGKELASSETEAEEVSGICIGEDESKELVSVGSQTEEMPNTAIIEGEHEQHDLKDIQRVSGEPLIEDMPSGSGVRGETCNHLDMKDNSLVSQEPQFEDVPSGSGVRGETWNHLDMKDLDIRQNLKYMFPDERNSDVCITVKDMPFKVHREVLEAHAPVLANFCSEEMAENSKEVIYVMDCEPKAFAIFILFVYSGTVKNLTDENVRDVLFIADKYSLPKLKAECMRYMLDNLTFGSICNVIDLALRHGEEELLESATDFFMKNAQEILPTVEWRRFMVENPDQANELYIRTLTFCTSNK